VGFAEVLTRRRSVASSPHPMWKSENARFLEKIMPKNKIQRIKKKL